MAQFTPDEIKNLKATSNGKFNEVWMARWAEGNEAITSTTDDSRRRRFLTRKYVDREWYARPHASKPQKMEPAKTEPLVKSPPQQANSAPPILLDFDAFPTRPAPPPNVVVDDLIDISAIPPPVAFPAVTPTEGPRKRSGGSIRDDLRSLIDLVPNARQPPPVATGPRTFTWD
jgi:hypothetical protein